MGGSWLTRFPMSCVHEILPRSTGPGTEWKSVTKIGGRFHPFLRGGPLKISFSNLNISKTGGAIFVKFSQFAGLCRHYLQFRAEVGGC